jgi:prepilin-type N-terminal cleavage/methylation domain-containing protein
MARRAFTLIEVVIAASIMAIVMLFVVGAMNTSLTAANFDMAMTTLNKDLRTSIDRITSELRDGGGDEFDNNYVTTHDPVTATVSAPTVSFRRRTGLAGAEDGLVAGNSVALNWSPVITYALVDSANETSGDGVDDDNDGLIDERSLMRTENGVTVMVVDNVMAFDVTRDPTAQSADELVITLVLGRAYISNGTRNVLVQTVTSRVVLRNRPRAE